MSTLTADIETKGLMAYEQARAFERLRAWRLPVSYSVFVLIPVIFGFATLAIGHVVVGIAQLGAAVLFAIGAWWKWRQLKERYARNLEVVAEMEKTYGDELPWVKVDKHFAELRKLQDELAREEAGRQED